MTRKLVVLYGSQTGTAQDIAENIWRESKRFHFVGGVMSMDDYDVKSLVDEEAVIFVCSTTGQGEEPDNMKHFWKFMLKKSLPSDSLSMLHFGVIGLGDSSYSKFNFVAKRLHKRLLQLGGTAIEPVGLCDDQHELGLGAVLFQWIERFWKSLLLVKPLPSGLHQLEKSPRDTRWKATRVQTFVAVDENQNIYEEFDETTSEGYIEVLENKRTTSSDHFQDVRLLSFSCGNLVWNAGDVAYVRPKNSPEAVTKLFEIFEEHGVPIYRGQCVMLDQIDDEMQPPNFLRRPWPLGTIATQYWDLSAIPRARAFEVLAHNCENEMEKEKLLELASFEGQQDLLSYVNRPRRTILEVLEDFPHATSKLTLDFLFELFQTIKPRPFSIASSVLSKRLDLLVAVVEYQTRLKAPRKGLCSNWLKTLAVGEHVRVSIKRGTFTFPSNSDTPLVMIGPGTGLAIFRSILQDQELKGEANSKKLTLFFGCRGKEKDFHCREELERMDREGLMKLFCAFSRDQSDKIYVQHLVKQESVLLKSLIVSRGGFFYISGSSKDMPLAVREALEEAIDDKDFVEQMVKAGRFQEETWS